MFNNLCINKSNLLNNIKQIRLKSFNKKICAMVKANAYGVGACKVVEILNDYVDFFGVASYDEAETIKTISKHPILITGAFDSTKFNSSYSYTCNSLQDVLKAKRIDKPIKIHLKINSGMNRYGIASIDEFKACLNEIENSKIVLEGVYTHFATSDSFVNKQLAVFDKFINIISTNKTNIIIHADNSHVFDKFNHNFDMVRIGFDLYANNQAGYRAVVTIKTKIVQINHVKKGDLVGYDYQCVATQNMKVAVLPIGYADGFDMKYLGLCLNIDGEKCKVLNICMDCFLLDISKTKLKKGDSVYILSTANPLDLYSNYSATNNYEVMCKFGSIRADRLVKS